MFGGARNQLGGKLSVPHPTTRQLVWKNLKDHPLRIESVMYISCRSLVGNDAICWLRRARLFGWDTCFPSIHPKQHMYNLSPL